MNALRGVTRAQHPAGQAVFGPSNHLKPLRRRHLNQSKFKQVLEQFNTELKQFKQVLEQFNTELKQFKQVLKQFNIELHQFSIELDQFGEKSSSSNRF
jgi:septal ring factor EnvC (AmiA/AmiB activator)